MMNPFRSPRIVAPDSSDSVPSPTLRARVVFACVDTGRVVVDVMTYGLISAPVALDAYMPRALWAQVAAAKLAHWASSSTEVSLCISCWHGNPRAKLTDGRSLMLLDLRRAPDLSIGLEVPDQLAPPVGRSEDVIGKPF
jgi:hypothetical protein